MITFLSLNKEIIDIYLNKFFSYIIFKLINKYNKNLEKKIFFN